MLHHGIKRFWGWSAVTSGHVTAMAGARGDSARRWCRQQDSDVASAVRTEVVDPTSRLLRVRRRTRSVHL